MRSREIEPAQWQNFATAFSSAHDGWLVSIDVQSITGRIRAVAHDVPLWGVIAGERTNDDVLLIVPEQELVIQQAQTLIVDETDDGVPVALNVVDRSGTRTIIEFNTPMRTELVDGMAVEHMR